MAIAAYAIRTLKRSRLFSILVICSLSIGIASNGAIFAIMNALLLHPGGVDDPNRLVAPRISFTKLHLDKIEMSIPDFADVRDSTEIFSSAAISKLISMNYRNGQSSERLQIAEVSYRWFDAFGARPLLGRTFVQEDDVATTQLIILSFRTWSRLFNRDYNIVGRDIQLNSHAVRVIGVMPTTFGWPLRTEGWVPIRLQPVDFSESHRFDEFYTVVARLKPGVSLEGCKNYLSLLTAKAKARNAQTAEFAGESQWHMVVEPFTDLDFGSIKRYIYVLASALGLLLSVVCSNLSGLALAKGIGRSGDVAVRMALGATPRRLVAENLLESSVLVAFGASLGMVMVPWLLNAVRSLAPEDFSNWIPIKFNTHAIVFTLSISLVVALLFGSLPALQSWRLARRASSSLNEGGRSKTEGKQQQQLRTILVIGQVTVTLLLVTLACVFLQRLKEMHNMKLGFAPDNVLSTSLQLSPDHYMNIHAQTAFLDAIFNSLNQSSGLAYISAGEPSPFSEDHLTGTFERYGSPSQPGSPAPHAYKTFVSPAYFRTLRIPLVAGRDFASTDRLGSQPVALIDDKLAKEYWPKGNAVGARIRTSSDLPWSTVIGVVSHVRAYDFLPDDSRGILYEPIYQQPLPNFQLLVRFVGPSRDAASAVERAVRSVDPSQAVYNQDLLSQRVTRAYGPQAFISELLSAFAVAGLILVSLGLYAVVRYGAESRKKELSIRSALGAPRWKLVLLVSRHVFYITIIGLFFGLVGMAFINRLLISELNGSYLTPMIVVVGIATLVVISLSASIIPALRVLTSNLALVLRSE